MKFRRIHLLHRAEETPPYTYLACVYDRLMDHVDYAAWAEYIGVLFDHFGRNVRRVVDGGCGTGSMTRALMKKGYRVAGFDRSFDMIQRARPKMRIPFWQGDLRAIALSEEWDAVLCLYDTIQYLTPEGVECMLSDAMGILVDGGLVVFDAVTERHVLKYWACYTERDRAEGWEFLRRSWYDGKRRLQHTEFALSSARTGKVFKEHHIQKVYRLEELERIVEESGFSLILTTQSDPSPALPSRGRRSLMRFS